MIFTPSLKRFCHRLINAIYIIGYVTLMATTGSFKLVPYHSVRSLKLMMTSSNGNIFRVTGHLCGKFTGPRWIPRTKASDSGALMFSLICVWINGWVNNREAGDLRRYRAHYDVIVMSSWKPVTTRCLINLYAVIHYKIRLFWGTQCSDAWSDFPAGTRRNYNVIITSKWRHGVILT